MHTNTPRRVTTITMTLLVCLLLYSAATCDTTIYNIPTVKNPLSQNGQSLRCYVTGYGTMRLRAERVADDS
jgi:prolipoprotein diacylglyceryltransferase